MNFTFVTADRATYRKVVAVALLAATLMVLAGILGKPPAPAASAVQPDPFASVVREV
jgi:hypothetical protein